MSYSESEVSEISFDDDYASEVEKNIRTIKKAGVKIETKSEPKKEVKPFKSPVKSNKLKVK